jgi:hypothetical protein
MIPEASTVCRQAIDNAASAIQNLARAFTDDRTPAEVRYDLERARMRLSAASQKVTDAIAYLVEVHTDDSRAVQ